MIQDGKRSVYFSRTSGGYAFELGLGNYVLTQGLSRKLLPDSITGGPGLVQVQGEGWVDVGRMKSLAAEFRAPAAIARKNKWVDRSSVGILYLYVSANYVLAEALSAQGDRTGSEKAIGEAMKVARATGLGDLFSGAVPPPVTAGDSARKTAVPARP